MTQPILPKLKPGHNVKNFNEAGKWDARESDSLKNLSTGLKVDKVETEISSIPDMWARPMLFEMALLNSDHVLHKRVLGEWRGLLAMIGLKELLRLNSLTVSKVNIPPVAQVRNGDHEQPSELRQRDFLITLGKLLPHTSLSSDTSWQSLYVFLFNNRPFAMTSPTTLVATAADYLNRVSSREVSWFDGTYLNDPVSKLASRHKEILAGWLNNLVASLHRHAAVDKNKWNAMARLLRDFGEDLGSGASALGKSSLGIQGTDVGIFKYLDRPAEGNILVSSHVELVPSAGRTPEKRLLVIEKGIAEQWDMLEQEVTVDGALTLASSRFEVPNAEVWKSEDFFNKKLFVIFQENAFPGAQGVGNQSLALPGSTSSNVTPLLPINPKLLHYLMAVDLAECIRWNQEPEGLVLHLFLRLTGPDPDDTAGRTVVFTKLYKREDIQTLENVPILEVWPNFRCAGWQAYYTCYSTDDVSNTFTLQPYAVGGMIASEASPGPRRQRRYWRSIAYPEAMICDCAIPNEKTSQMETVPGGLLLLAPPQKVDIQGTSYKIGIDFGASSTTICAGAGKASFPVNFENRKTSVTASGDRAQAQLFDFFLPRRDTEMPVLSFFHDFNNNLEELELRPFLDGHAYLLETAELFDPGATGLAFDLKWSREEIDRRRVKAFLSQLCLQAAAELIVKGASSATWAFSYPTAFSYEQMEGFPSIWKQVTQGCAALSGLKLSSGNVQRTESEASAVYFVEHCNAATAVGTIFVDIGGSTSDICIWQDDRPVWQTSVLLAGRSIFSNYLWHHPEFLGSFGVDTSRLIELKQPTRNDRRPYHAYTDALLRYNSEKIFQHLPLQASSAPVRALRQHLALGVSGLFYYVGSLLRYLISENLYRQELPNVFIGGNGSRIFRWLDIDREGHINSLYKAVFSRGADWEHDAFQVILSPEPKIEAAYGLTSERQLPSGNTTPGVLAGERVAREGDLTSLETATTNAQGTTAIEWNTILTPEIFTQTLRPPKKLEKLAEFIDTFNKFARDKGLLPAAESTDEQLEEVRRRLGQQLNRYRGSKETSTIVVEPVFIMALRQWLEIRLGG